VVFLTLYQVLGFKTIPVPLLGTSATCMIQLTRRNGVVRKRNR
jgi:hypothetical protein